jgi:hypothetical protein
LNEEYKSGVLALPEYLLFIFVGSGSAAVLDQNEKTVSINMVGQENGLHATALRWELKF